MEVEVNFADDPKALEEGYLSLNKVYQIVKAFLEDEDLANLWQYYLDSDPYGFGFRGDLNTITDVKSLIDASRVIFQALTGEER